jgi:hypothetical protein
MAIFLTKINSKNVETDPLSLHLDQTTPQSILNGQPIFTQGFKITAGQDIRPSADSTTAINIAQADGTDFVTFDTTNKRVGIGTTSPNALLEVYSPSAWANIRLNNGNTGSGYNGSQFQFFATGSQGAVNSKHFGIGNVNAISAGGEDRFAFQSRNDDGTYKADLMSIMQNTGNVGIGTTAPSAPFHSVGTSFPTAIFELVNAGSGGTSSAFNLYRNQSSPLANDGTGIVFSFNNGAGAKTIFARLTAIATSVTSGAETSAMTFDLGTTLAEKMRITSAGKVGIGTTTPSQTLDVRGSINQTNGSIYINNLYGELWFDNDSTQLLSIPVNNTWYNISFNLSIDNGNSTNGFTIHNGTSLVCTHSGLYDFRYSVSMETTGTNKEYNIAITNGTDYYHNTETHTKLGTIGDVVTISDGGYIRCNPNVKLSLAVRQVSGTNDVNIHQAHLNAIRIGN